MRAVLLAAVLAGCTVHGDNGAAKQPEQTPEGAVDEGSAMVWPDEDFRYNKPEPRPPTELQIPPIETFEVAPGIEAYLAPRPSLPTVSMWLSFPTGSIADPVGRRGMTSMCMSLLDEGTATLDKVEFEARQADLASSVWSRSSTESVSVGVSSLTRTLEPTVDLMVEMLRKPGLRQADLDRIRSSRLTSLKQNKAAPGSLGRRLWRSVVYGPQHAYGDLTSERAYKGVKLKDCKRLIESLRPENARLFVAGAITADEVKALLEPRLKGWEGSTPLPKAVAEPAPRTGTIFFVHVPDAAQSQIYIGHPGPSRTAPDYEANRLMAAILGGSFSGRVNMNIREDKGYAYGARARFTYYKHHGAFAATTSVRSDATEQALRELAKEIQRMRTAEVDDAELERERAAVLLSLPAKFSTARRMLGTYSSLVHFGLPLDYYDGFVERVQSVDKQAIQEAAVKNLRASDFKVLVVGDGKQIRKGLEKLTEEGVFGDQGLVQLDGDGVSR